MSELTIADCRPEVLAFAILMERELLENDHKTGWKDDRPEDLFAHLESEVRELRQVLSTSQYQIAWRAHRFPGDKGNGWSRLNPETREPEVGYWRQLDASEREAMLREAASEAADIANMAMMVVDVCGGLANKEDKAA